MQTSPFGCALHLFPLASVLREHFFCEVKQVEEIIAAVIAVAVSVIGAAGNMFVSWLNKRRAQSDIDALRQAVEGSDADFFVVCPYCGKRVRLKDVQVYTAETVVAGEGNVSHETEEKPDGDE